MAQVFLLISILTLVACSPDKDCTGFRQGKGPTRIIAFGDSQTAGHASESSLMCGYSYANILAERHGMQLINTAVPGSEFVSEDQYGRLMTFEFRPTDHVIISAGFNDMGNHYSDPDHLALFRARLKEALARVAPLVDHVAVVTAFQPPWDNAQTQAALALYRQTTRDVVAEVNFPNIYIGDAGDGTNHDPNYFADNVHFNFEGQTLIANDVEAIFQ
jgi:lysophospholipase L1-like esterase